MVNIVYDESFTVGCETSSITCRCNKLVIYDQHAPTRPKYCAECAKQIRQRIAVYIEASPEFLDDYYRNETRRTQPPIHRKTIQELITRENL